VGEQITGLATQLGVGWTGTPHLPPHLP